MNCNILDRLSRMDATSRNSLVSRMKLNMLSCEGVVGWCGSTKIGDAAALREASIPRRDFNVDTSIRGCEPKAGCVVAVTTSTQPDKTNKIHTAYLYRVMNVQYTIFDDTGATLHLRLLNKKYYRWTPDGCVFYKPPTVMGRIEDFFAANSAAVTRSCRDVVYRYTDTGVVVECAERGGHILSSEPIATQDALEKFVAVFLKRISTTMYVNPRT
jgi:hypothetical protein